MQISEGKALKNENLILKINIIMKTKMSNYRNCFALAYVLLVAVIFCGCGKPAKQKENIISAKRIDIHWFDENGYSSEEEFTIITIDSCEYLLAGYDRSRMITHKGN
mgnify:CR=1 FL=1